MEKGIQAIVPVLLGLRGIKADGASSAPTAETPYVVAFICSIDGTDVDGMRDFDGEGAAFSVEMEFDVPS